MLLLLLQKACAAYWSLTLREMDDTHQCRQIGQGPTLSTVDAQCSSINELTTNLFMSKSFLVCASVKKLDSTFPRPKHHPALRPVVLIPGGKISSAETLLLRRELRS